MEKNSDKDPGRAYWILVNAGIAINITLFIDLSAWHHVDRIPSIALFLFIFCFISPLPVLLLFKRHSHT